MLNFVMKLKTIIVTINLRRKLIAVLHASKVHLVPISHKAIPNTKTVLRKCKIIVYKVENVTKSL